MHLVSFPRRSRGDCSHQDVWFLWQLTACSCVLAEVFTPGFLSHLRTAALLRLVALTA